MLIAILKIIPNFQTQLLILQLMSYWLLVKRRDLPKDLHVQFTSIQNQKGKKCIICIIYQAPLTSRQFTSYLVIITFDFH